MENKKLVRKFYCDACGGYFENKATNEEVRQEAIDFYGKDLIESGSIMIVCDACFQKVRPANIPNK